MSWQPLGGENPAHVTFFVFVCEVPFYKKDDTFNYGSMYL